MDADLFSQTCSRAPFPYCYAHPLGLKGSVVLILFFGGLLALGAYFVSPALAVVLLISPVIWILFVGGLADSGGSARKALKIVGMFFLFIVIQGSFIVPFLIGLWLFGFNFLGVLTGWGLLALGGVALRPLKNRISNIVDRVTDI